MLLRCYTIFKHLDLCNNDYWNTFSVMGEVAVFSIFFYCHFISIDIVFRAFTLGLFCLCLSMSLKQVDVSAVQSRVRESRWT